MDKAIGLSGFRGARLFLSLLFLLSLPAATLADTEDYFSNPLRPLDASSPKATLQDFIRYSEIGAAALSRGDAKTVNIATERSREALDFSEIARSHSWDKQTRRMLYLKEILDRLPADALDQAPDADEVRQLGISSWRIPKTRIEIARIDSGDRVGEFVFSADTVNNLHNYYRRIQHLPILSGKTHELYEQLIENRAADRLATRIRDALRPVEALSPRAVVDEFLFNMNQAYEVALAVDQAMDEDSTRITRAEAAEAAKKATLYIDRAVELLDLSNVPSRIRDDVGRESALMLKEIIDRAQLPPMTAIPSERAAAAAGGEEGLRWLFPHTGIEILRLNEGHEHEQYRFSAFTVANVQDFYKKVEDLPYRGETSRYAGEENTNEDQYTSAGTSPGFYERYIQTPGTLVPEFSMLAPFVDMLPEAASERFAGQTVWQWMTLLLSIILLGTLSWGAYKLVAVAQSDLAFGWSAWLHVIPPVITAALVRVIASFLDNEVNLTGWANIWMLTTATALTYLFVSLAIFRAIVAVIDLLFNRIRDVDDRFESLVHLAANAIGFVVGVTLFVYGIRSLGIDVIPLVAGLGVGGLAVALAIRPTLENIFGGIILFADRPVHVGDFCSFGDQSGTVEKIGLRSTRIRARNRTLITVPNAVFSDMEITNWAVCDSMQIKTVIGVRYETTPEQMRWLLAKMRQLCFAHPKIENETLRVRMHGFGASSLDIAVRVYALTTDWNEYFAIQEDLWLRFMDAIAESGTSIAFPSTTIYMGEDSGMDVEATQRAEAEVDAWRASDQLPFPLTPEPLKDAIIDTLDYPPKGSPGEEQPEDDDTEEGEDKRDKPAAPGPMQ